MPAGYAAAQCVGAFLAGALVYLVYWEALDAFDGGQRQVRRGGLLVAPCVIGLLVAPFSIWRSGLAPCCLELAL